MMPISWLRWRARCGSRVVDGGAVYGHEIILQIAGDPAHQGQRHTCAMLDMMLPRMMLCHQRPVDSTYPRNPYLEQTKIIDATGLRQ
jgi:hypothetical protein